MSPSNSKIKLKPGKRVLQGKELEMFNSLFGSNDAVIPLPENFDYKKALEQEKLAEYDAN